MDEQPRVPPWPAGPSIGFTLSQLGFATSRRFGELMGTLGLEPRHFALLREVRSDGQSQQEVAQRLRIPPSTMVSLVDHLERQAMIERRPHPTDRRTRLLHLTERGATALREAIALGAQWEDTICTGISPEERQKLLALLRRVAVNIGVMDDELPDRGTGQRPESLAHGGRGR